MARTYEPIASQTLGSTATSVTFSNIPATYTDLVIVAAHNTSGTPTFNGCTLRLNSDTGSNYSTTRLRGDGSSAASNRTSGTVMWFGTESYNSGQIVTSVIQLMSYANTNVFKTALSSSANAGFGVWRAVGLWRNTSAVTSVTLLSTDEGSASTPFTSGSTFSLYGIKAA